MNERDIQEMDSTGDELRNLDEVKKSLPATWYYDADQYQRELEAIWYRDWVCVGRLEDVSQAGQFFVATIGRQKIVVTEGSDGLPRAYYNTCRHRGSVLCRNEHGKFHNGRIICPYHTWTYSTDGKLLATPGRIETDDFNFDDYDLYPVRVDSWGGFIFLNLSDEPDRGLAEFLGEDAGYLKNWPLETLHSVKQETMSVACNWKIFWENYCECYHCPRVHPELCKVMPVYRSAVFDAFDLPGWKPKYEGDDGGGAVGDGAKTWTMSGETVFPTMTGPTEREIERGVIFSTVTGSMYIVGHPDYVRSVRIIPTGPETIDLVVDWLLPKEMEVQDEKDLESICELARLVIEQDGEVCELNQLGLRSRSHRQGMLVPQEYELWDFHEWLREKLERNRG